MQIYGILSKDVCSKDSEASGTRKKSKDQLLLGMHGQAGPHGLESGCFVSLAAQVTLPRAAIAAVASSARVCDARSHIERGRAVRSKKPQQQRGAAPCFRMLQGPCCQSLSKAMDQTRRGISACAQASQKEG